MAWFEEWLEDAILGFLRNTAAITGLCAGALASYFATRAMTKMIFGLKPDDPATFLGIAALFSSSRA